MVFTSCMHNDQYPSSISLYLHTTREHWLYYTENSFIRWNNWISYFKLKKNSDQSFFSIFFLYSENLRSTGNVCACVLLSFWELSYIVYKTLVPGSMDRNSRDKVGIYSYTDHKIRSTECMFWQKFYPTFLLNEVFGICAEFFPKYLHFFFRFKTTIEFLLTLWYRGKLLLKNCLVNPCDFDLTFVQLNFICTK